LTYRTVSCGNVWTRTNDQCLHDINTRSVIFSIDFLGAYTTSSLPSSMSPLVLFLPACESVVTQTFSSTQWIRSRNQLASNSQACKGEKNTKHLKQTFYITLYRYSLLHVDD